MNGINVVLLQGELFKIVETLIFSTFELIALSILLSGEN